MIRIDSRVIVIMKASELHTSKDSYYTAIGTFTHYVNYWCLCLPSIKPMSCSREFLERVDNDGEEFLDRFITQDETTLLQTDP